MLRLLHTSAPPRPFRVVAPDQVLERVDPAVEPADHPHYGSTFLMGVQASRRCFSPRPGKRTTASVLSPEPMISSTTPSPHFPCTTSSPTARPSRSAPLVRAGVGDRRAGSEGGRHGPPAAFGPRRPAV